MSGYITENQGLKIGESDVAFLAELSTPPVTDRAVRLLRCLAKKKPQLGQHMEVSDWLLLERMRRAFAKSASDHLSGSAFDKYADQFRWLGATWSEDFMEMSYLLESCLSKDMNYVEVTKEESGFSVKILPKGWALLESAPQGASAVGFVAMWFGEEAKGAWEQALYPGIREAGYTPLRIDQKQHNGKIDDEIIASIRSSKFVVADFTGQRGGVYFEAGLAFGLGKQVIWTVREDEIPNLHFDTRQFNHIVWKPSELPAFRDALRNRIEATLGKGPILPNSGL